MALDLWCAETGTYIGWALKSDYDPRKDFPQIMPGKFRCPGIILVAPPGHSKTELAAHFWGRRISDDPYEQGWVIHAQIEQAILALGHVASMFDMGDRRGRRNRALYPNLPTEFRKKNEKMFWLQLPNRTKQPTMMASGKKAQKSGGDATFLWFDDPVDQKEIAQESERANTHEVIQGTWMRRLRGKSTFHVTTTTLWHPDDANCRRIKLAREGKLKIAVSIQGTGGPRTFPKFKPLWPEMYSAKYLERAYIEMANPTLFSAAFMSDPVAEASKIIKELRYFDPADPEHSRFLAGAEFYFSLDPAATSHEKSDRVGVLYCGFGDYVEERTLEDGATVREVQPRLRILDADQFHATQTELVESTRGLALSHKTDHLVVETRGAFVAVAEMFENMYGIKPIRIDPGNRSKAIRLKAAAPLIEDGSRDMGIRAVVEFPGVKDEHGKVVPNPKFNWLFEQILCFGFASEDHCVDCLTQLVIHLAHALGAGKGAVTTVLHNQVARAVNERTRAIVKGWMAGGEPRGPAPLEDLRFMLECQR